MDKKQERLARQWAAEYLNWANKETAPEIYAAAEIVLATIPAPPTMEDVEWDHEEHYLAGATHEDCTEVIMHSRVDATEIATIRPGDDDHDGRDWSDKLFPNGKKYQLVEVTVSPDENLAPDQPEHPKFLETPEDYKNAPEGTVVVDSGFDVWLKVAGDWESRSCELKCGMFMLSSFGPCRVLNWGEEA